jgi:hypothetical protein
MGGISARTLTPEPDCVVKCSNRIEFRGLTKHIKAVQQPEQLHVDAMSMSQPSNKPVIQ